VEATNFILVSIRYTNDFNYKLIAAPQTVFECENNNILLHLLYYKLQAKYRDLLMDRYKL